MTISRVAFDKTAGTTFWWIDHFLNMPEPRATSTTKFKTLGCPERSAAFPANLKLSTRWFWPGSDVRKKFTSTTIDRDLAVVSLAWSMRHVVIVETFSSSTTTKSSPSTKSWTFYVFKKRNAAKVVLLSLVSTASWYLYCQRRTNSGSRLISRRAALCTAIYCRVPSVDEFALPVSIALSYSALVYKWEPE